MAPRFDMSDLSHHNKVTGDIDAVFAQLPYGATTKVNEGAAVDVVFRRNIDALRRRAKDGKAFSGGYFWPLPSSRLGSLIDQAKFFLDQLQPQRGDLIQMDNEQPGLAKSAILDTLEYLAAEVGRPPLNYMGVFYGGGMIKDPAFRRWPWWLPAYVSETRRDELVASVGMEPAAWQWGGDAQGVTLPGITGRIDANRIEDMAVLRQCAGYDPIGGPVATLPVSPAVMPGDLSGKLNGRLPATVLTTIAGDGQMHHLAARAWAALVDGCRKATGLRLDYTARTGGGAYRTYARQEQLLRERAVAGVPQGGSWQRTWNGVIWYGRKGTAPVATPGTSNHGWGLAIDAALDPDETPGGPVVSITPVLPWLIPNALRYGFSWESQVEPWHLRYVSGERVPQAVLAFEQSIPEPAPKEADVDLIRADGTTAVFARAGTVSWVQGPQVATFRALYGDPKPVPLADLKLYGLVGPIPVGDTRPWAPEDFAWLAGQQGPPGEKGDKGDPGEGVAPGTVIPGEFRVAG